MAFCFALTRPAADMSEGFAVWCVVRTKYRWCGGVGGAFHPWLRSLGLGVCPWRIERCRAVAYLCEEGQARG